MAIASLRASRSFRSELGEESRIVLIEQANIIDGMPAHAKPFDAEAERANPVTSSGS